MSSSPSHQQPCLPITLPPNASPTLLNHPPIPVDLYPGLPQNSFAGAEAPPDIPPQGPVFNAGPQNPQPPAENPWHGNIYYEEVAQPRERQDFNAELMDQFRHAHRIPVPAPAANSNALADDQHEQFNIQFHQHIINFEAEAEVRNNDVWDAEQAQRKNCNVTCLQQAAQEQMLNIQSSWLIRKDNIRLQNCFIINMKLKLNVNDKNLRCIFINVKLKLNANNKNLRCIVINMKLKLNINDRNLKYSVINRGWSRKWQLNNSGNRNGNILMNCIRNMGLNQQNSMLRIKEEIMLTIILILMKSLLTMLLFILLENLFLPISQMFQILNHCNCHLYPHHLLSSDHFLQVVDPIMSP
ncbi:hypothetical protein J3A83DRAFT_4191431 [Scleroderma citrinum]